MPSLEDGKPEQLERAGDQVSDAVSKLLKSVEPHKGVPERYLDGEVAIHLHMWLRSRDDERAPGNLCAVFQRLPEFVVGLSEADVMRKHPTGSVTAE